MSEGIWRKCRVWVLALIATIVATACEPMFVFAGGALSGSEEPAPDNWTFSRDVDTVQIETRPSDPYSVNVWGVAVESFVYVAASDGGESRWAREIEADSRVRLKIGERLFALRATRLTAVDAGEGEGASEGANEELARVVDAYVEKYDLSPDESFVGGAWVFRLQAR